MRNNYSIDSGHKFILVLLPLLLFGSNGMCQKALLLDFPKAIISNGLIEATLYLPDKQTGYYRATRFDWSGVIGSLEYNGHSYFGQRSEERRVGKESRYRRAEAHDRK